MREELGIDDWLELVKEDKNLNGAYISFAQYMYLLEKENQELKRNCNIGNENLNFYREENQELKKQLRSREEVANKYKEIIDKAINDLNIIIDIVREQPLGDCWIINRLEGNKSILKEVE